MKPTESEQDHDLFTVDQREGFVRFGRHVLAIVAIDSVTFEEGEDGDMSHAWIAMHGRDHDLHFEGNDADAVRRYFMSPKVLAP
jgi:hypothetical protein